MKSKAFILSFFFFGLLAIPGTTQPGGLDASFGEQGIVIAPLTVQSEQGYKTVVQSDGKILLAGFQEDNSIGNFFIVRYNTDGSLDDTFGTGGMAVIDGGTDSEYIYDMVLQDDGRILLGGSVYNQFTTVDDFALVRLNTNGSPDNTFGTGGIVITDIDNGWDNAYGIAIQNDGKILLCGDGYTNDKRNVCVIRYNIDGSLDASFGSGGIAMNSIGCSTDRTRDIAVQADGKIVVCGYFNDGADDHTFVNRFNTDGTVDVSFGNSGIATLDIGGNDDRFWTLCILPDEKILTGGYTRDASAQNDYLMVRYLMDGSLDNNFGSNGIKMHNFNGTDIIIEMVLQADGKILTAGGAFTFELARFLDNGDADAGFGNNGIVNTNINTGIDFSQTLCLQNDGKIIVAGHSKEGGEYDFSLARYHLEDNGGIADQKGFIQSLKTFPNPVRDNHIKLEYILENTTEVSIELLSMNGQLVEVIVENQIRLAGDQIENIQLQDIPAGLYFIRISTHEGSRTIKFEQL